MELLVAAKLIATADNHRLYCKTGIAGTIQIKRHFPIK